MTTTKTLLGLVGMLGALAIAPVQAQTEVVLHSFTRAGGDYPDAGVIRDSAGNLYGTTFGGSAAKAGVVYKLDKSRNYTVLYSFMGVADGSGPRSGVIRDSSGNLYGTTLLGGTANAGVVYEVNTSGQETVLYSFAGGADGANPYSGVIRDSAGNLYGTTYHGGTASSGVLYKVDTSGHETVLHSFAGGADGASPYSEVIRDSVGNLYGTTYYGGTSAQGVVYELDAAGTYTVLYSFTGKAHGGLPVSGVIRDTKGDLYGTTYQGGTAGAGVLYKLDAAGREIVLHTFTGGNDGGNPNAGVIRDSSGNLYGTAHTGEVGSAGVVYKVDTAGNYTALYSFTGADDGAGPIGDLIRDAAGGLYGTAGNGGKKGDGVIFEIKP